MNALEHVVEENRMRCSCVRTPKQDNVRLFNLAVGAGAPARPEYRRQTDDAGSVSSTVTTVDIVAAHSQPRKLLRQVIHLIRGLRTTEEPEPLTAVFFFHGVEPLGGTVERFVPRCRTQHAVLAHHRLCKPLLLVLHSESAHSIYLHPA